MATIAVTGASGLIGRTLVDSLTAANHQVYRLVRTSGVTRPAVGRNDIPGGNRTDGVREMSWDPATGVVDFGALEGIDAVVHLAGEPIGDARWTAETKRRIRDSRVTGTTVLAEALAQLDAPPRVFVSGSAVGFYGNAGARPLTEDAPVGDDFLAHVCRDWEAASAPAARVGIRVVHPRTGVVIARSGPLMDKVRLPFRLGLGGRIGDGNQYVPWISLTDHVRALRHLIDHELEGPVNLVGPHAVTNRELTTALGRAMRRPTVLPIPVLAIRMLYGEMGVSLATASQNVVPAKLIDTGFSYEHPDLDTALRVALSG